PPLLRRWNRTTQPRTRGQHHHQRTSGTPVATTGTVQTHESPPCARLKGNSRKMYPTTPLAVEAENWPVTNLVIHDRSVGDAGDPRVIRPVGAKKAIKACQKPSWAFE